MTPEFAKVVDPIFLHVLGLLDRIAREDSPVPQDEREHILALLGAADAKLGRGQEWELGKYALVSWLDEVLVEAPWEGRNWWNENVVEVKLFNTRLCNELFYTKAQEAGTFPRKDALEIFYVCVVLGFRGLYRDPESAAELIRSRGMPPDLETWAKQTALAIRLGQGRPPIAESAETGQGAPPLQGQSLMIGSVLLGVILAAFTLILGLVFSMGR